MYWPKALSLTFVSNSKKSHRSLSAEGDNPTLVAEQVIDPLSLESLSGEHTLHTLRRTYITTIQSKIFYQISHLIEDLRTSHVGVCTYARS